MTIVQFCAVSLCPKMHDSFFFLIPYGDFKHNSRHIFQVVYSYVVVASVYLSSKLKVVTKIEPAS